jgi:DNA-binding CsgD family transcriptional regulator
MLTAADNRELLQALRCIGEADGMTEFATRACAEMLRLVPGVRATYQETNLPADRVDGVTFPDPGQRWFDDYIDVLEQHINDHPHTRYFRANPTNEVVSWTDIDPDGSYLEGALYRELYLPNGIRDQIAFLLPAPRGIRVGLGISRDATGFDRRERALLSELRTHLVHLFRLVSHAEARRQRDQALADDGWSVVLVDDAGTVLETNPAAIAIGAAAGVNLGVGARLSDGPLWSAVTRGRGNRTLRAGPAAPTRMSAGLAPFQVRLLRSSVGPHVLWIREPNRVTVEDAIALGLTQRQAQIALLLADGLTNEQIGGRLSIAPGTVRKHLEAIFERLDVPTRAAAVGQLRSVARSEGAAAPNVRSTLGGGGEG